MLNRILLASIALAVASAPLAASEVQPGLDDDHPATARLTAEQRGLVPGTTAYLGVLWEIDDGWHMYWKGVNDSGFAPEVTLSLPGGFEAGDLQWPAPKRKIIDLWEGPDGKVLDHAYEGRLLLMIPVRVPEDAQPGTNVNIKADLDWLICEEVCIPGSAQVSLSLPVVAAGEASPGRDVRLFETARQRLPKPLPAANPPVTIVREGGTFIVAATTEPVHKIAFYPTLESAELANLIEDGETSKARLVLRLDEPNAPDAHLQGVVEIWSAPETSSVWWIDTGIRPAGTEEAGAVPAQTD